MGREGRLPGQGHTVKGTGSGEGTYSPLQLGVGPGLFADSLQVWSIITEVMASNPVMFQFLTSFPVLHKPCIILFFLLICFISI